MILNQWQIGRLFAPFQTSRLLFLSSIVESLVVFSGVYRLKVFVVVSVNRGFVDPGAKDELRGRTVA